MSRARSRDLTEDGCVEYFARQIQPASLASCDWFLIHVTFFQAALQALAREKSQSAAPVNRRSKKFVNGLFRSTLTG
jgi:hypothetical protein